MKKIEAIIQPHKLDEVKDAQFATRIVARLHCSRSLAVRGSAQAQNRARQQAA